MIHTNLTRHELIEKAPKDKDFLIRHDNEVYQAYIASDNELAVLETVKGYHKKVWVKSLDIKWYEGYYDLILEDNQNTKPEVYQVGDKVEILENARECGDFHIWASEKHNMVGQLGFEINEVVDGMGGIRYWIYNFEKSGIFLFPHYCVRRIEKKEETINIEGKDYTLSQIKKALNLT
jgi:hypothetical protein